MLRLVTAAPPMQTQQQILDYVNSVATVSSYVYALTKTELPVLNFPPSWYADFAEKLAVAKADSLSWIYSVVPTLQLLPRSLINFNSVFQQNLSSLVQNLQVLKANPNNTAARQELASVLQTLLTEVQSAQTVVQSLDSAMDTFAAELQPDAQTLNDLASNATTAAGADTAQVQKLDAVIENFRQAIASEEQRASLENLLKGDLALFIVGVAMTIGWVGGPIVDGILAMAAIGILAGIGDKLASEPNVQAFQAEIGSVQQEIGAVNTEVALLQNTSTRFTQLLSANSEAQQALSVVRAIWDDPAADLAAMIQDLNNASTDLNLSMLDDAIKASQGAASTWNQIEEFASSLNFVQFKFDPTVYFIQPTNTQS